MAVVTQGKTHLSRLIRYFVGLMKILNVDLLPENYSGNRNLIDRSHHLKIDYKFVHCQLSNPFHIFQFACYLLYLFKLYKKIIN